MKPQVHIHIHSLTEGSGKFTVKRYSGDSQPKPKVPSPKPAPLRNRCNCK